MHRLAAMFRLVSSHPMSPLGSVARCKVAPRRYVPCGFAALLSHVKFRLAALRRPEKSCRLVVSRHVVFCLSVLVRPVSFCRLVLFCVAVWCGFAQSCVAL